MKAGSNLAGARIIRLILRSFSREGAQPRRLSRPCLRNQGGEDSTFHIDELSAAAVLLEMPCAHEVFVSVVQHASSQSALHSIVRFRFCQWRTIIEDGDFVVVNDGIKTVRDREDSAIFKSYANHLLNLSIRLYIDRRSTLIHNQKLSFGQYRPCEAEQLPFACNRKIHATWTMQ